MKKQLIQAGITKSRKVRPNEAVQMKILPEHREQAVTIYHDEVRSGMVGAAGSAAARK